MTKRVTTNCLGGLLFLLALSGSGWAQVPQSGAGGGLPTIALVPIPDKANPWAENLIYAAFQDAMFKAGRFTVLSRSGAEANELKLSVSGMVDPASAVSLGKKLAAKYIVTVQQVSYEAKQSKTGFGGIAKTSYKVTMELQAQAIETETTGLISSAKFSKSYDIPGKIGIEGIRKPDDPSMLDPYRKAVDEFADSFTKELAAKVPMDLVVVSVSNGQVALNGGTSLGLRPGTEFEIIQQGDAIKGPDGATLGYAKTLIGRVTVASVEAQLTWCRLTKTFNASGAEDPTPDLSKVKNFMVARMVAK